MYIETDKYHSNLLQIKIIILLSSDIVENL